jgi:hypothetical protein
MQAILRITVFLNTSTAQDNRHSPQGKKRHVLEGLGDPRLYIRLMQLNGTQSMSLDAVSLRHQTRLN